MAWYDNKIANESGILSSDWNAMKDNQLNRPAGFTFKEKEFFVDFLQGAEPYFSVEGTGAVFSIDMGSYIYLDYDIPSQVSFNPGGQVNTGGYPYQWVNSGLSFYLESSSFLFKTGVTLNFSSANTEFYIGPTVDLETAVMGFYFKVTSTGLYAVTGYDGNYTTTDLSAYRPTDDNQEKYSIKYFNNSGTWTAKFYVAGIERASHTTNLMTQEYWNTYWEIISPFQEFNVLAYKCTASEVLASYCDYLYWKEIPAVATNVTPRYDTVTLNEGYEYED